MLLVGKVCAAYMSVKGVEGGWRGGGGVSNESFDAQYASARLLSLSECMHV